MADKILDLYIAEGAFLAVTFSRIWQEDVSFAIRRKMWGRFYSYFCVFTYLQFDAVAFNLIQLYFFRCIRGFRKKGMLQIDIIEDIRDEILTIKDNWNNSLFIKT